MNLAAIKPQLLRAQSLLQTGQATSAWSVMAPLRTAIDDHGQALRLFAMAAFSAGRIDEAASALRRVADLEDQPPDILGAIADAYSKAGRHEEAFHAWSDLAARHHGIAEAHLNRAVAASKAGLHDEAIRAADEGMIRFPGEARLLATKALALQNAGRVLESVPLFGKSVAADPNSASIRHNQARALRAAGRYDDACDAFAMAKRTGMNGAPFHAEWAETALEANRVEEAESLYRTALAQHPEHDDSRKGLTRLRVEHKGGDDAFGHYEKAALEKPSSPRRWIDWSRILIAHRQFAAAAEITERGLKTNQGNPELTALGTFCRGMTGDATAALADLDSLLHSQPKDSRLRLLTTQIAFRAGRPERAAELFERRTAENPADQHAWAMLGLAWRLMDDPREHWLCDYDRLVMVADVHSPDGKLGREEFAREVAKSLDPLHVTSAEPGDQSLRGGTQSIGDLFGRADPVIRQFRDAVTQAAASEISRLPDDPTHPFLSRKSQQFAFSGSWSVRLASGGRHAPHVHPKGWMSSAYYARLPTGDEGARQRQEGWIQFGILPDHLELSLPARRTVEPAPGRLVLFPSYMWHGTIPFEGGDRLTAAFDYIPR